MRRVAPGPDLGRDALDDVGEAGRVPRQRPEHLGHQADEVAPEPGHGGELQPVRHLVQRQPEPELARGEAVLRLDGDDVGADVGDEVLLVGALDGDVVVDQQVVLAEHACRHVGEHQAQLHAGDAPADDERRAAELGAALLGELRTAPDRPTVRWTGRSARPSRAGR